MTIGSRIKSKRLEKSLTQEELAKKVNTSKQTIQRYEAGIISNIPSNKIELLAEALNVTPAYLLGWDEEGSVRTIGFDNGVVDLDTGKTYTDEQWKDLSNNYFSIKIEQHRNLEFKCFLTDTQKELLISMIKSWGVECYERKDDKNV